MPRILFLDIETRPIVAEVWSLRNIEHIGLNQVRTFGGTICVGAKWSDQKKVQFFSDWQHGHRGMLDAIHDLWSRADAVCGYNSDRFDLKKLRGEFCREGMAPPPPTTSIDVFKTVKSEFGFDSNKLDHVAHLLGLGSKIKHEGHALWTKVLDGDEKARRMMERYCVQDVKLLEKVYYRLLPWMKSHPHLGFTSPVACPKCGSEHTQKRGVRRTKAMLIERIACQSCGGWADGKRAKVAHTLAAIQ